MRARPVSGVFGVVVEVDEAGKVPVAGRIIAVSFPVRAVRLKLPGS
jgi:hypothetical protein